MNHIPAAYVFALLGLAAWRTWKLAAHDSIFDRPRERLLRGHEKIEELVTCPFCLGAYISVAWWLAWLVSPMWATVAAVPFALSAAVGLIASAYFALTDE